MPTKADQPANLKLTLLPFQRESLFWMRKQEQGIWHGGMLAVRSISFRLLLRYLSCRPLRTRWGNYTRRYCFVPKFISRLQDGKNHSDYSSFYLRQHQTQSCCGVCDCSSHLLLCLLPNYSPTVAIMQWRNEIETHTDGLKVLVWHGSSRETNVQQLGKYDVVCQFDDSCFALIYSFHRS